MVINDLTSTMGFPITIINLIAQAHINDINDQW